ncbi:polyprenyl synthetase family protein [Vagococcus fessus]|uniref:Geranylgeranyl pyrophosphate synthase n=1 Tax=Vagococcus fessus TaxID=120370 RepID=A0A430A957_9ENTE|nr:polyprenyl synthetase family protein [Vagococcus fessus]RSU03660.1 geranylgeranyl pyrophosphate synthase [Vagococcus fessus]
MKIHKLWHDYPNLAQDLQATLNLMERSIKLTNKDVEHAIFSMMSSGGKLLRPAYLLLFSQFGNQEKEKAIALAAAMETLHTATLIHDDIVDEAEIRRNVPTIQSKFGKDIAVYAGDYLFITCFKMLADYTSSLKSIQINARSMENVLSGELGQMNTRYDTSISIKTYLKNISGKTAELFALSCFVGAYEAGCSQLFSNNCKKIGNNIGMAFQVLDDILDYTQDSNSLGKPVLEDVRQGVYSLPLILAIQKKPEELLPLLKKKSQMNSHDTSRVYDIVHQSGAIEDAKKIATDYTDSALKSIQKLPNNTDNTKNILHELTSMLLTRHF